MFNGVYQASFKRIACRNDYCTTCQAPRLAEGRRTLIMLHFFFVPVLPVGVNTRWFCSTCKKPTDAKKPEDSGKLALMAVFGALFLSVGVHAFVTGKEEPGFGWFAVCLGALCIFVAWTLRRIEDRAGYERALAAVVPLATNACPYCKVRLFAGPKPQCHQCGVTIVTDVGHGRAAQPPRKAPIGAEPPVLAHSGAEPPPLPRRDDASLTRAE